VGIRKNESYTHTCDRCGKQVASLTEDVQKYWANLSYTMSQSHADRLLFCDTCMESMFDWVTDGKRT